MDTEHSLLSTLWVARSWIIDITKEFFIDVFIDYSDYELTPFLGFEFLIFDLSETTRLSLCRDEEATPSEEDLTVFV